MALNCPFCSPASESVFHAGSAILALWDAHPVSQGHALLIPKRHVETWFDATPEEQAELTAAIAIAKQAIEEQHTPDGYNIGINVGPEAGQTVFHLHVHVIPRYRGDVDDPRGGVRSVIPAKKIPESALTTGPVDGDETVKDTENARYAPSALTGLPRNRGIVTGGLDDPLIYHLRAHLDDARRADIAVAFVLETGVIEIEAHLAEIVTKDDGRLRLLTGDYQGVTEPGALRRLLDLTAPHPERVELRVYETGGGSFHPKSYIVENRRGEVTAYVGSSNLTRTALRTGVEWNYRPGSVSHPEGVTDVQAAFERLFKDPKTKPLDAVWIDSYEARRATAQTRMDAPAGIPDEPPPPPPDPHAIQQEALAALGATRDDGNRAGLVVMGTGLGKTWLAAFDSAVAGARRVLFVAHREEILAQALSTFRRIRPEAKLGFFNGLAKIADADVLFASVQTLSRRNHLDRFDAHDFDYIIIDEFHHAAAATYRRVIGYFEPEFLLGLTATPERTDGGDLLGLCGENLVYRCDFLRGIRQGLLSPFHYFGVPDEVDYANIPWRSSRFDEAELTLALATEKRAANALAQLRERGGTRTLAFCCSRRHADFMCEYFRGAGMRAAAVHSGETSDPRATSLELLEEGELDVVCAVDMFNEGVDIPEVDTVLMLRPTESRILWLQQLGRGLRQCEGKTLKIIDYIGNHRSFLLKPQALFGLEQGDRHVRDVLVAVAAGSYDLPPGCEVTYDLEAVRIFEAMLHSESAGDLMRTFYEDFLAEHGERPTAPEAFYAGLSPRSVRKSYGSWLGFIEQMGGLTEPEQAVRAGSTGTLLEHLETTPMSRSFKMLVLLAMIEAEAFPGRISIEDLVERVRKMARRSVRVRTDLGVDIEDAEVVRRHLEQNPIAAWVGGQGTGGDAHFAYEDGEFRTVFGAGDVSDAHAYLDLARELAEWRLVQYLDRPGQSDGDRIVCSVTHNASGTPILMLPDRERVAQIPKGWVRVRIGEENLEANFVKIAVNVMRREDTEENVLGEVLRGWFGEKAGASGTAQRVVFERGEDAYELVPVGVDVPGKPSGAIVGKAYKRADIPGLFDQELTVDFQRSGFIVRDGHMYLLVTLDKSGFAEEHKYGDRFLSGELFEWQSQNRTTQSGKHGQLIKGHRESGVTVHLFVRERKDVRGTALPYVYCGDLDFVDWEREKPITVRWRLQVPLSADLQRRFAVGRS